MAISRIDAATSTTKRKRADELEGGMIRYLDTVVLATRIINFIETLCSGKSKYTYQRREL